MHPKRGAAHLLKAGEMSGRGCEVDSKRALLTAKGAAPRALPA
jgi:hypothetical protein